MPEVDVVDDTWFGVAPRVLAPYVADPTSWRRWWPDLSLQVAEWRGQKGMRWTVPAAAAGKLAGSMEIWLQDVDDGTVAHFFLRLDGVRRPLTRRERARYERAYRVRMKSVFWALADRLDPGRIARLAGPLTRIP
jgi:hypothetical protein